jgi:hypothetical protein
LVNLIPVTSTVGGNVVVSKSHLFFPHHYLKEKFYEERLLELQGDDWMEIPHDDDIILQDANLLSCLLSPGDMLLWDSRTVHCSYPGSLTEENATVNAAAEGGHWSGVQEAANGLIRAVALVSMMPTERATRDILEQRRKTVDSSRTMTHWANQVAPLGNERPDDVALEAECVQAMRKLPGPKVLLGYHDLSRSQQTLVVGESMAEKP